MKYFILYEATIVVETDEEKYIKTLKNNIEIDYPLISSQIDIESIEDQLMDYLTDIYDESDLSAEVTEITLLNFKRFDNDYNINPNKIQ